MDIYSTSTMNGVVDRLRPRPTFFLDTFFPEVIEHATEEVFFDKAEGKRRITPLVHPLLAGKLVQDRGYTTKSVKPAYAKDLRVHNPNKALKRLAGEPLGGKLTPDQRLLRRLMEDQQDQLDMLIGRFEVMAAEAVIFGRQTLIGDGINSVVSFGRPGAHSKVLAGAQKWDTATADLVSNFEDWDAELLENSGANAEYVIMDIKAWKLLRNNEKFYKQLDLKRGADAISLKITPMLAVEGVKFRGFYGDFPIFTYSHSYTDPADGVTKNVMPNNTVVLASRAIQGVRHFGIIMDLAADLKARQFFTKSWEENNPSAHYLLLQSSPLMVPYRTEASMVITVA